MIANTTTGEQTFQPYTGGGQRDIEGSLRGSGQNLGMGGDRSLGTAPPIDIGNGLTNAVYSGQGNMKEILAEADSNRDGQVIQLILISMTR